MTRRKSLPAPDPPETAERTYERGVVEERARWETRPAKPRKRHPHNESIGLHEAIASMESEN